MMRRVAAVVLTAAALLSVSSVIVTPARVAVPAAPPPDPLVTGIARAQERLRRVPGDWVTWAALGSSYVERARITGDPSLYAKAESALGESQRLRPNDVALAGLGALANSRHDFAGAAAQARAALALNAFSASAYGVLADALTQLGDAPGATDAVQRMLDLDPGLPALARAAYDLEQRGQVEAAGALLTRALRDASGADAAFVRSQLGDLAWHAGDFAAAEAEYTLAGYRLGLARVRVIRGEVGAALELYAELSAARPDPALLAEYAIVLRGDLHKRPDLSNGHATSSNPDTTESQLRAGTAEARPRLGGTAEAQLRLADAALALLAANGGTDNLAAAEVAIARGDFASAVRLCETEWRLRQHTDVADLLGWSLHLAGRDTEALAFARRATAFGIRHRGYVAHLRIIEETNP